MRRALGYGAHNMSALSLLAEMLAADGKRDEARDLLRRVVDAPLDARWASEDRELNQKAAALLRTTGR